VKTNKVRTVILVVTLASLAACSSAQRKVNKADAKQTQEQTKTMQEYKSCVKKAKQDEDKLDACERLLKANQ
jgi:outer membrane biogenesis lipoprotein LolB